MLKLQLETWRKAREDMGKLFPNHWEEVAVNKDRIKLAMHDERYLQIEDAGMLHLVTARVKGELIGYFSLIINYPLHYRNDLMATSDFYYIVPEHRTPQNAIQMFRFAENTLKEKGVKFVAATTKVHHDKGKFLEFMGWKNTEKQYTKVL